MSLTLLAWLFMCCEFRPLNASNLPPSNAGAVAPNTMVVGCSSTGATGAITLSNVPSRFTGVAPLAVFFDATGTTASATSRPFHELEYRWVFDDPLGSPVSGVNWNAGSRPHGNAPAPSSRNDATGPVAAHVFETPGTYTISVTVTDGTSTVANNCTQILVQDAEVIFSNSNTICIGSTSLPVQGQEGCPVGALAVQQSNFATAISSYATTGKRVLFKRGDTFTTATPSSITRNGPGIVGAFGTGAAPKVQITSNSILLNLSSRRSPGISDWRVMDLELDGSLIPDSGSGCPIVGTPPGTPCNNVTGIATGGGFNQVTLLRLNIHDMRNGIQFSDTGLDFMNSHGFPSHTIYDQVAIVDSSVLHMIGGGGGGVGFAANRLSMQGNIVDDTMHTEHVLRIFYLNKGVISNNTFSRQAPGKAVIKMHAPAWCSLGSTINSLGRCTNTSSNYLTNTPPIGVSGLAGGFTEQVVVSDNKLIAGDNTDWTFTIRPQNAINDERLRNIIVERNWFVAGNKTSSALVINAAEVTVRNNICDATNSLSHKCFLLGNVSVEPPPTDIRLYNNTFYSASAGNFVGVDIRAPAMNTTVQNNLGSAPFATIAPTMITDAGVGTVQGNNLLQNKPSALFVNATPITPVDFILKSPPNPARNAGLAVPVFSDFFRTSRPQRGQIDLGATEQ